jgi:hypothetical protein
MFIIPQMVLSGAMVPLPVAIRAPASSSWAFQGIVGISGAGSDVARDTCWDLTKAERDDLTLDEKNKQCNCMGENAVRENSCTFPGLGDYYDAAIDEADPAKPAEPGPKPEEPVLPTEPAQPANPNSLPDLQLYLQNLTAYNDEVSTLQNEYKDKVNAWQKEQEDYKTNIETYQKDLTDLEVSRAIAVGSAESTIERYKDDYGWTFVNKNDRSAYIKRILSTWGAQLTIILILFIGTVYMQKRRDVV